MSYNLGNWAEKLTCELCGVPPIDLDLPDDYYDPSWDPMFDEPPEPDDGPDWEVPGVPLPGDGEATPTWNDGPGIELTWPWG